MNIFEKNNEEEMKEKAMFKAREELAFMVIEATGLLEENSDAPNGIKCAALCMKISSVLRTVSERATDDDVVMLRQLYEALSEREKENEA